jgi:hypothetical protein
MHRYPVEHHHEKVFGVKVYSAYCHQCQSWVRTGFGQFCWVDKASRNRATRAHRRAHAVENERSAA